MGKRKKKIKIPEIVGQSKKRVLLIARQYEGTSFYSDHRNEYMHAFRNGYFQQLTKILQKHKNDLFKADKKRIISLAKRYRGNRFRTDHFNEYHHAHKWGYLEKILKYLPKAKARHSMERTLTLATKYKGNAFWVDHPNEYAHAQRNSYLKQLGQTLSKK